MPSDLDDIWQVHLDNTSSSKVMVTGSWSQQEKVLSNFWDGRPWLKADTNSNV